MTDNGLMMIRRTIQKGTGDYFYSFYTPHFFDRYRERELKGADLEKPDVIYHYVVNNPFEYRDSDNYEYKDEKAAFLATCNTGLACGVIVENNVPLYKTYISRNDLSKNKTVIMKDLDHLHKEEIDDLRFYKKALMANPELLKDNHQDNLAMCTLITQ